MTDINDLKERAKTLRVVTKEITEKKKLKKEIARLEEQKRSESLVWKAIYWIRDLKI